METTKQLLNKCSEDIYNMERSLDYLMNTISTKLKCQQYDNNVTFIDQVKILLAKIGQAKNSLDTFSNECLTQYSIESAENTTDEADNVVISHQEETLNTHTKKEFTMKDFCNGYTFDIESLILQIKEIRRSHLKTNTEENQKANPEPVISVNYAKYLQNKQQKFVSYN